jgi:hypothetical protein
VVEIHVIVCWVIRRKKWMMTMWRKNKKRQKPWNPYPSLGSWEQVLETGMKKDVATGVG